MVPLSCHSLEYQISNRSTDRHDKWLQERIDMALPNAMTPTDTHQVLLSCPVTSLRDIHFPPIRLEIHHTTLMISSKIVSFASQSKAVPSSLIQPSAQPLRPWSHPWKHKLTFPLLIRIYLRKLGVGKGSGVGRRRRRVYLDTGSPYSVLWYHC